jgi:hypothetical protein
LIVVGGEHFLIDVVSEGGLAKSGSRGCGGEDAEPGPGLELGETVGAGG